MTSIIDYDTRSNKDDSVHTLYLGSFNDVNGMSLLHNKIKTVINLAKECDPILPKELNIKYYKYDFVDSVMDFYDSFNHIIHIIQKRLEHGSVLVHCKAGRSRSATIILAYLIKTRSLDLFHAFIDVREKRGIFPHPNFMRALMEYEKEIFGTGSYDNYIDIYSIKYLMNSLDILESDTDNIRREYEACDKDYNKTEREILKKFWGTNNISFSLPM